MENPQPFLLFLLAVARSGPNQSSLHVSASLSSLPLEIDPLSQSIFQSLTCHLAIIHFYHKWRRRGPADPFPIPADFIPIASLDKVSTEPYGFSQLIHEGHWRSRNRSSVPVCPSLEQNSLPSASLSLHSVFSIALPSEEEERRR